MDEKPRPTRDWVPVNDGDRCYACSEQCDGAQLYQDGLYFCSERCADQHSEWDGDRDGAIQDEPPARRTDR